MKSEPRAFASARTGLRTAEIPGSATIAEVRGKRKAGASSATTVLPPERRVVVRRKDADIRPVALLQRDAAEAFAQEIGLCVGMPMRPSMGEGYVAPRRERSQAPVAYRTLEPAKANYGGDGRSTTKRSNCS
jgi:hypothetical protein